MEGDEEARVSIFATLTGEFGLLAFTAIAIALVVYLGYSMVHPERF